MPPEHKTNGIAAPPPRAPISSRSLLDSRAEAALRPLDLASQFAGARFMVLGGTGFLGKVFWSMLLARYPEVGKIYLLVRSSKGKTSEARFWENVATSPALDPLRDAHGDRFEAFLKEKVVPIDGDTGRPLSGIDADLLRDLHGTIDAVVNVAGVVDFSPPLDESLDANAFGCQNLVAMARALGPARARPGVPRRPVPLMHTSTCYVAGKRPGPIAEVHPSEVPFPRAGELGVELWDPDREIAECLDLIAQAKHRADDAFRQSEFEEQARKNLLARSEPTEGAAFADEFKKVKRRFVADRLIESGTDRATHWGWPNIYTYTKSIGEQVIALSGLPFTIVRPACCESTVAYPFPGWNEGISTSVPMIYLAMKGHMILPLTHVPLDFIPSDMVCAGMIMSLGELLDGTQKPVYQYGSSDTNPCTAARFGELVGLYKRKHYQKGGGKSALFDLIQAHYEPYDVSATDFERMSSPAIARGLRGVAGLLKKTGAGPLKGVAKTLESAADKEDKIGNILRLYAPFTAELKGPFSCAATRGAYARLTAADKEKLPWTPESIDWLEWMHNVHMPALEKWVFPEMDKKLKRELKPLRAHETLVTLLDQMAERHELSVALQRFQGESFAPLTYGEFRQHAHRLAALLADFGVKRGDRVVLTAKNDPTWPIAFFGIVAAGATAVPVDVALEMEGLANIVKDSLARVILSDRADVLDEGAKNGTGLFGGTAVWNIADVIVEDGEPRPRPSVEVEESDVASLIYTSGTTGVPKGVRLSHKNFTSLIASLAPIFPLGHSDRVLSVLPLHHTFEFTCGLLLPLSRGARVAYLDELNGERVSLALKKGRITAMVGVPALWQLLERRILSQVEARGPIVETVFQWAGELNRTLGEKVGLDIGRVLLAPVHSELGGHVKYLISGGAALPSETYDLFAGLGLRLTEGYGLTEAAPVLTVASAKGAPRAGHVGKPIPGVEVRIDSPDERGVGEIVARGPNVMLGYTSEEATRGVLTDDGWLHTGDLGKFDKKGRLSIVGRIKDVIVTTTGENVYPDDVEAKLGSIPHVTEYAVVGIEGQGGKERVACLAVPEADEETPRGERMERAMRSLREKIGELPYGQQPTLLHLYDAPLPRTATRKVKRTEVQSILRRMVMASTPPPAEGAKHSAVEHAIATVSGRPVAAVTGHATLQGDLGFDSLMLTELLEALEARGEAIDPHALQQCRTVSDVERLAGDRGRGAATSGRGLSRTSRIDKGEPAPMVLPKPVQEFAKTALGKVQHAFYDQAMQAKVYGRAFVPHNRPTIVVANHASHLDMGLVKYGLGSYGEGIVSLAAQDYFFESGIKRAYFENFTNLVAFDRKSSLRASLRQAAEVIDAGKTVLLFPEGTRNASGEITEFKALVGYLALTHGIDILPVYLGGTEAALPKGAIVPVRRDLLVRIGPPLAVADLRRLTEGLTTQDAAREVAKLAHRAVVTLKAGDVLDIARLKDLEGGDSPDHPLVTVFHELEEKFVPNQLDRAVSFYFALGGDDLSKWTVRVDAQACEIRLGKPDGGVADCVLKTTPEIFTRIVRESYVPGPAEFLSGAVKSNDVSLLFAFQKAFAL